jgi:hypothetical protein
MSSDATYAALSHRFGMRAVQGPVADAMRVVLAPLGVAPGPVAGLYEVEGPADGSTVTLRWQGSPIVEDAAPELAVSMLAWHVNDEAVRSEPHRLLVHAAAVAPPDGGAVLIAGASGAGKSSVAAALGARGWHYLTDEVAALDATGRVLAYPRALSLSGAARARAEGAGAPAVPGAAEEIFVAAASLGARPPPRRPMPVAAIVVLDVGRSARSVRALRPGEAVLALGEACFNLRARAGAGLAVLRDLALRAPAWQLAVEGIDATADLVGDLHPAQER